MSERWKPKQGERYWVVDTFYTKEIKPVDWVNASIDNITYNSGNCFKTKAEAESAAEKVKALLLSLHEPVTECNQLPKLTAEVFNHPDCPEWARYAAVDMSGIAHYFDERPYLMGTFFYNNRAHHWMVDGDFDASDWRNSLIERPTKLPDWCKVGEWVYLTSLQTYKKIADEDERAYIKENGFAKNLRQARLRPYTADEMKALVGKVIDHQESGDRIFVIGYDRSDNTVETMHFFITATQLLNEYTIDGAPCGKFEHLENGEWV